MTMTPPPPATPTLNHVPRTISSPIVQCLLELDLAGNPIAVNELTFADLKTESYLATFPMGTSPSYQDGDSILLWESGAILDYLLERYDTAHKLSPPNASSSSAVEDIAARSKYLQLKQFIIATAYPFIASLFIHTLKPVEEQDASYVDAAKSKWNTLLGPVLTKWLGGGPYFLGERMTAVDFLAAKPLYNCHSLGLLSSDEYDFPELMALLERMRSRPTFAKAYASDSSKNKNKNQTPMTDNRTILLVPNKQG